MARFYDHFHIEYVNREGETDELEGGWTGFPNDWDEMSKDQRGDWLTGLAQDWGMPDNCRVERFWLAG